MAKPIQNDPENAQETFSGRLGAGTRFHLEITGPLDANCMGRLIETLKTQQQALAGTPVNGATK